jgi:acetolactate synthase regulatory subunit
MRLKINEGIELSLESEMSKLALEANILTNLIDQFRVVIPKLGLKLKEVVSTYNTDNQEHKELVRSSHRNLDLINKQIHQLKFIDYAKTLVAVPEGFNGSFLAYLKVLNSESQNLYKETLQIISEYNLIISAFITNKSNKISLQDYTSVFKRAEDKRKHLLEMLSAYQDPNSDLQRRYLNDVIGRWEDLPLIQAECETLLKDFHTKNLKDIKTNVNHSCELLEILIKNLNDQGFSEVSGISAQNIATGALEVAKMVEAVSIYNYKINEILKCVNVLFIQVEKITK